MTLVSILERFRLRVWVLAAVALSAIALVWLGYRAVAEWRQAAGMVATRRAESAVELLMSALTRDMRGAQTTVLSSADRDGLTVGKPLDLMQPITVGLSRYSYVDAFFAWSVQQTENPVAFYVRTSRQPAWLTLPPSNETFPVVQGRSRDVSMQLMNRVRVDASQGRRFSVFDLPVGTVTYQVVAILSYADTLRERPSGVLGYMVNVAWAREHYFPQVAEELAVIEGSDHAIRFTIAEADEPGVQLGTAAAPARTAATVPAAHRLFPLTFFDPLLISLDPPADLQVKTAVAVAVAEADPTVGTAQRGARRTLALAAIMAVVLVAGLALTLQAGAATAKLSEMRSDFVSAVTHELKAPIANLRAIHQTVASGRLPPEAAHEYAEMGVREANRLGRLVDNLLAYARITDITEAYSFEPVALKAIVEDCLGEFAIHLKDAGFAVRVDVPATLPPVRADVRAVELMLSNLIDNAIRYSGTRRDIAIAGKAQNGWVALSVADQGIGIAEADREMVTRKFFRGRQPGAAGSGLGLAIVDRIVKDHSGMLDIHSEPGRGTTVTVSLPRAT